MSYKLGSLFDGSGGFPLSGALCGIEPAWAAEVEPYPIAVTRSRFPKMKHLGDISKINGAEIEPVDIITFGSPCQDLSVAGKRAGLKHEANGDEETTRSGLFMEAVRIIKEMRQATNGEYPRFALWENVPGAFSSNKGEDFRIVCEELIKIVEPSAFMPDVPQKGWAYADSYIGDGWSLAYRVFDAQYWGVPQRRRRIHLVADFRGQCAREVLFERQGVRGYFEKGRTPWQDTPANAQGSTGANDSTGETDGARGRQLDGVRHTHIIDNIGGQAEYGKASPVNGTLRAGCQGAVAFSVENHPADSRVNLDDSGKVQTLTSRMGTGGGNVPMVMEPKAIYTHPQSDTWNLEKDNLVQTLSAGMGMGGGNTPLIMEPFCKSARGKFKGDAETWKDAKVANTLNTFDQGETRANELVVQSLPGTNAIDLPAVAYGIDPGASRDVGDLFIEETSKTLTNGSCPGHHNGVVIKEAMAASKASFFLRGTRGRADCLVATDYKDPQIVAYRPGGFADYVEGEVGTLKAAGGDIGGGSESLIVQKPRYIVRRLTPTECARLQGFADRWGDIDKKDDLTDEEYSFWLEVRNTHAAINGRAVKDYTKKQMLTWYNKLQTDSAEYKMWGNGIALPPALYCMQGVVDVLSTNTLTLDDWML